MPDGDVAFIGDLIYHQNATIIAESALAAFDGESILEHRGDKSSCDFIPLLPGCFSIAAPFGG